MLLYESWATSFAQPRVHVRRHGQKQHTPVAKTAEEKQMSVVKSREINRDILLQDGQRPVLLGSG